MAEYNGSGTLLRRYIHGLGVDDPVIRYDGAGTGSRRYLHSDERGSIIAETNASGGILTSHRYGPYGEPINGSTSRFRYTGQALIPGTELYHYKARVYHPTLGRFLQTDPVGYEDQMNLYAYVHNDPVNMRDPTGEFGLVGFGIGFGLELGFQFIRGEEINLTKATVMGVAGAFTGGVTALTRSSVSVGGRVVATTGEKVVGGGFVTVSGAVLNTGAGAINDSMDGQSSAMIVDNALENFVEGLAPHVKVTGKIAGKLGTKMSRHAGYGEQGSGVVSQAASATAERAISDTCNTIQNKC